MFKMSLHDPLKYIHDLLWLKEGSKVKVFDFQPLKVKIHPDLHVCKWWFTYYWKALDQGYNFALNFALIESFHKKLWTFKMVGVLILKTCESRKKWHLNVAPMEKVIENIIMGKMMASPSPWWILWVYVCPWFNSAPKAFQLSINQLVVWFV
jgi:hypothetical protein